MNSKETYRGGSTPGMNQALGLPFGEGMQKVALCFDVDGTLISDEHKHVDTIKLLIAFGVQRWKNVKVVVWSGGGEDYARFVVHRLGIENHVDMVMSKMNHMDLRNMGYLVVAMDDIQDTRLGDVNLIVRNK